MAATWTHPQLGEFQYHVEWTGLVSMPGFAIFTYEKDDSPGCTVPLTFDADDANDTPSDLAAAVAVRMLANQADLANKAINALWDDLNGRGPRTGMWWHDHLDEVIGTTDDLGLSALQKPLDLAALLGFQEVFVYREIEGYARPIAELRFAAAFEDEHGIGILTDGVDVLGIGYIADVRPFESST